MEKVEHLGKSQTPRSWLNFLRLYENKPELFSFLEQLKSRHVMTNNITVLLPDYGSLYHLVLRRTVDENT